MKAELNIIGNTMEIAISEKNYTDKIGATLRADGYELASNGSQDEYGNWYYIYVKAI